MRKKGVLLSTLILGLALTACGDIRNLNDLKEAIGLTSDSSGGDAAQEESTDAESLPASQEYVSSDGSYQVIMLEGFTQTEAPVLAGSDVMMLENDSERKGFGAFCVKTPKSNVSGNPGSMESLEDYADYIANLLMKGSGNFIYCLELQSFKACTKDVIYNIRIGGTKACIRVFRVCDRSR